MMRYRCHECKGYVSPKYSLGETYYRCIKCGYCSDSSDVIMEDNVDEMADRVKEDEGQQTLEV